MQKTRLHITAIVLLLLTAGACQKGFLDNAPLTEYSDKNVWTDSALISRFVIGIYGNSICNYDFAEDGLMASLTDEAAVSTVFPRSVASLVNLGQYTAGSDIFRRYWAEPVGVYTNVRSCNLFLSHLPDMPLSDQTKRQLTGEVRFLRAYNYHFLYSLFGRFPIIDTVLSLNDHRLYTPRGADESCIAFILADYKAAAAVLPTQYPENTDLGRVTKGAALGMQCRLLLNQKRYPEAAAAAKEVMSLGVYELFKDYGTMFQPENDDNEEVIFNKEYGGELTGGPVHAIDNQENSTFFSGVDGPMDCPTQNLVDQYLMTDGLPYHQSPLYDPAHPYANRDPRLEASVLYDSAEWRETTMDMTAGSLVNPIGYQTPTGYMLRKFLNPDFQFADNNANYQNCIILRLAEIYLNYAECQLKMGNGEEARKYVNLLRARVNMPEIPQGQMTWDAYVRERTVELAFEGERWADIRRWGMGPQLIGAKIYGMEVTNVDGVHHYKRTLIQQRYFAPKMYLFPIPLAEMMKYPPGQQLQQNPGWD